MRVVQLAGRSVAAIGCGDVSLARAAARGVDAGEVGRALHEAIEAGIDVVEVADDAESLAGDVVRTLRARDRAVVATRAPARHPRELTARVETSLRNTRLDAIPLVLLDGETRDAAELRGTCERLVREGKVLAWGTTGDFDEDWLEALAAPFNLCERKVETKHRLLARRPLAGAALAGTLGPGVRLAPGDDRRELPFERIARGVAALAAYVKREPPAARSCDAARAQLERNPRLPERLADTVAELALRFVIDRGAIALPRLHRREHVAEAISAASSPPVSLPEQIFSMLDET